MTASSTLQALAEPHRVAILDVLREGETPVGQLASRLGQSQPGISKHLMVLRQARLVTARRRGRERLYRIDARAMADALAPWLARYEPYWSAALERLRRLVEAP